MKNKSLPLLLLLLGMIPYAVKFPYIVRAWQTSPLDRPDVYFFILAILMAAALLLGGWRQVAKPTWQHSVCWLAILALALFGASFELKINLLGIVAAVIFAWTVLWWIYGWSGAWRSFPVAAMLLLTCTSSHYWLSYFLADYGINGLLLKSLLAIALIILMASNAFFAFQAKQSSFFFYSAFLVAMFLYLLANNFTQGPAFNPEFADPKRGEFLGRVVPLTDADLRFFQNSVVEKYHFAAKNAEVDVLIFHCQDDIHQVHPASHCLRSSGWHIKAEEITSFIIENKIIPMTEILAESGSSRILLWVWFSNQERSTGGFLGFRRFWRPRQNWREYQLSTKAGPDLEAARNVLLRLLNSPE